MDPWPSLRELHDEDWPALEAPKKKRDQDWAATKDSKNKPGTCSGAGSGGTTSLSPTAAGTVSSATAPSLKAVPVTAVAGNGVPISQHQQQQHGNTCNPALIMQLLQAAGQQQLQNGGTVNPALLKQQLQGGGTVNPALLKQQLQGGGTVNPALLKQQLQSGGTVNPAFLKQQLQGGGTVNPALLKQQLQGGSTVNPALLKQQLQGGSTVNPALLKQQLQGGSTVNPGQQQQMCNATMASPILVMQQLQQQLQQQRLTILQQQQVQMKLQQQLQMQQLQLQGVQQQLKGQLAQQQQTVYSNSMSTGKPSLLGDPALPQLPYLPKKRHVPQHKKHSPTLLDSTNLPPPPKSKPSKPGPHALKIVDPSTNSVVMPGKSTSHPSINGIVKTENTGMVKGVSDIGERGSVGGTTMLASGEAPSTHRGATLASEKGLSDSSTLSPQASEFVPAKEGAVEYSKPGESWEDLVRDAASYPQLDKTDSCSSGDSVLCDNRHHMATSNSPILLTSQETMEEAQDMKELGTITIKLYNTHSKVPQPAVASSMLEGSQCNVVLSYCPTDDGRAAPIPVVCPTSLAPIAAQGLSNERDQKTRVLAPPPGFVCAQGLSKKADQNKTPPGISGQSKKANKTLTPPPGIPHPQRQSKKANQKNKPLVSRALPTSDQPPAGHRIPLSHILPTSNQPPVTASQDTASHQDTATQDTVSLQDTASQDTASQDTVSHQDTAQDTVSHQDTASQDTASQDTASQDTVSHQDTAQDTVSHQDTAQDTAPRDTATEHAALTNLNSTTPCSQRSNGWSELCPPSDDTVHLEHSSCGQGKLEQSEEKSEDIWTHISGQQCGDPATDHKERTSKSAKQLRWIDYQPSQKHIDYQPREKVELKKAEFRWARPSADRSLPKDLSSEVYLGKFKGILNKITPQKFQTLAEQALQLNIKSEEGLGKCIDLVFTKALLEPAFSEIYANLCKVMTPVKVEKTDAETASATNFRRILLTKCQLEFEKGMVEIEKSCTESKKKQELPDDASTRKRFLSLIKFIGELFKVKLLSDGIIHECISQLLGSNSNGVAVECLGTLLHTVGKDLEKSDNRDKVATYFQCIKDIIKMGKVEERIRFLLQDVQELQASNWIPRVRQDRQLKTIDQIHDEVRLEQEGERRRIQQQREQRRFRAEARCEQEEERGRIQQQREQRRFRAEARREQEEERKRIQQQLEHHMFRRGDEKRGVLKKIGNKRVIRRRNHGLNKGARSIGDEDWRSPSDCDHNIQVSLRPNSGQRFGRDDQENDSFFP